MNDNLPPLPETEWQLYMPDRPYEPAWVSNQDGFDSDQMREYGQLCRQQALEEAAIRGGAACDALMDAARVAEAIRSLK